MLDDERHESGIELIARDDSKSGRQMTSVKDRDPEQAARDAPADEGEGPRGRSRRLRLG
jgi:hypothetical protein